MSGDFIKLLAYDAVETLWRANMDSTLFPLIKNGKLIPADDRLAPVAEQLAELAESGNGDTPIFLHGEVEPGALSSLPPGGADPTAVYACVLRTHLLSDAYCTGYSAAQPFIEAFRDTHRLWMEKDRDASFLVFVPQKFEAGWQPLGRSPPDVSNPLMTLTDGELASQFSREFTYPSAGDGLYTVELVLRAPKPVISGIRLRQRGPAFPFISKGLVIDVWGRRLLPFNNRPLDEWSHHLRPYNDVFSTSVENCGNFMRVAFRVRLSGAADALLDIIPAWSNLFRRKPMATATGSLEIFDLRLTRFPFG